MNDVRAKVAKAVNNFSSFLLRNDFDQPRGCAADAARSKLEACGETAREVWR
jgi:hypothetical protein